MSTQRFDSKRAKSHLYHDVTAVSQCSQATNEWIRSHKPNERRDENENDDKLLDLR